MIEKLFNSDFKNTKVTYSRPSEHSLKELIDFLNECDQNTTLRDHTIDIDNGAEKVLTINFSFAK